jgi:cephalosporin-C deacetylase-like acetyl esterase
MKFTENTVFNGMRQRDFTVGDVPGVLWTPPASGPTPLVLLGHGGGRDKKAPAMSGRAERLVANGFSAVSIDAPGHGDRPRTPYDEQEVAVMQEAMAAGEPVGPIVTRYNADIARRAVPEWLAVLDALLALPEIAGPVGYFGLNMGTAIGVPLVAAEPRIAAAVFGLFWADPLAETARRVTVPVEFALQWDDEHIPRESGLALFDAFASKEKSLHANTGAHKELPRFEADSAVRFFARHLM